MGTRVSYPVEVKMKAIEMRLAKVPVKEVMEELNIRNETQLKTWMRWYRNGEIVAQTIGFKQDTHFVLDTLSQLPELAEGCILHSDQGSVYTSYAYQKAVKEKGITMSMSRKGTPADNSPIESFHSTLKSETFYLDDIYRTTNACVIQIVEEYITYYNNIRIQTKLNSQSPVQYRQLAA